MDTADDLSVTLGETKGVSCLCPSFPWDCTIMPFGHPMSSFRGALICEDLEYEGIDGSRSTFLYGIRDKSSADSLL
jgi:hypothetical protein